MVERKRIALIFNVNPNWMGGTYYILNIINTLNSLPDKQKPEIFLLVTNDSDFEYAQTYTNYPYVYKRIIKFSNNIFLRIINRIIKSLFKFNPELNAPLLKDKVDIIFPMTYKNQIKTSAKKIFWIADFQEKFLPEYFDKKELKKRDKIIKDIIKGKENLVLSSYDALNSFLKFYPNGKNLNISVYRFTITLPILQRNNIDTLMKKFKINNHYFYCANQFWVHKNHKLLIEAINILKLKNKEVIVVCSGSIKDFRNPNYYYELQKYVVKNNLKENIRILGLIERKDQISLMANSIGIIQPSLFEGWSSSIEEAKALNKFLILSDLDVHKEQAPNNSIFFDRFSAKDLADKIEWFIENKPVMREYDYNKQIEERAQDFFNIISSV